MYEECNGAEKYYFYDSNGVISGIRYFDANGNMTMIYVVTNALGDVIALYDKNGNAVVEYQYDAWGNIISVVNSTEGSSLDWNEVNPFRYRGYYWDSETGLYYLQSRYYDAEVGRFLNADSYFSTGISLLGFNMFAYCNNNPIAFIDVGGNWPNWSKLFEGVATAVVGMVAVATAVTACVVTPVVVVTTVVGVGVMAFGAAEIEESFTEKNPIKETVFNGNEEAYQVVKFGLTSIASLGTSRISALYVCFIAGTSVFTENGYKNIEEIKPGDKVWATNPETGETELKKVVRNFVNETDELVYVYVNNEEIVTTPEHPFYVSNYGWVGAINLRAGDGLVLVNGEYAVIERVQHEILENPIKVYNFEVEDFHTYYVGNTGVLVHNSCGALLKGKPSVPKGSTLLRVDIRNVKSQEFKDFIRLQGKTFRSSEWKYKMETWITESGKEIERHYWYNKYTGESYFHL